MSNDEKPLAHKRLPSFEMFDEIRIRIVPRYKTSYMSGDEWRHHAQIEFMFKGSVVAEKGMRDMSAAVMALGGAMLSAQDSGMSDAANAIDGKKCDQPSCQNDAVARFVIKRHTADDGSWLDPDERNYHRWYRKFCTVHCRRGDCSREDCDDNYEPIDGIVPDASTNTQESPAGFGGVVEIP